MPVEVNLKKDNELAHCLFEGGSGIMKKNVIDESKKEGFEFSASLYKAELND